MSDSSLNHYTCLSFTHSFWQAASYQRKAVLESLFHQLQSAATKVHFYQVFPSRPEVDLLVWSSQPVTKNEDGAAFFDCFASALSPYRSWVQPVSVLWGYTRPSQYARGKSAQEIEPLDDARNTYLVVYPFVKTAEWYMHSRDARQGMMNEHIRLGHQYPEIKQLLLYSFGLQEQEFVVVYEMEDLQQFSNLVNELRSTDARPYTLRDTPTYTAVHRSTVELLELFGKAFEV